jgi:hypothetical protein
MTLLLRPRAAQVPAAEVPTDSHPKVNLAGQIEEVRRELERVNAASNRDLDAEIAELRQRMEDEGRELDVSVERLRRLAETVRARRSEDKVDPEAIAALRLLDERDELSKSLQGLEGRRRLTFLQRDATRPTRIFEVSASRIVETMALGDSSANVYRVAGAQNGAELLVERIREAHAAGQSVLLAVKPSGRPLLAAWQERFSSGKEVSGPVGIEPIVEDRWISDHAPVGAEPSHGG